MDLVPGGVTPLFLLARGSEGRFNPMLNLVTLMSLGCLRQPVRTGRFNPMLNLVTLLSRVTLAVVSCYTPGTARGGFSPMLNPVTLLSHGSTRFEQPNVGLQCFGDLIRMEGTNAEETWPYRPHSSATPSPRATYTPLFQNKGPL